MKSIIFLNNALIILLGLSACQEPYFLEKKPSLEATDVIRYDLIDRSSQAPGPNSENANGFFCYICREYHKYSNKSTRCIKIFDSLAFVQKLNHIIRIKNENPDFNCLDTIRDKFLGYGLYSLFNHKFNKYVKSQLSEEDKDRVWVSFLKIINIKEELPRLAFRFTQVTKSLEEAKDKFPAHPIYLHFFKRFEAFGQQINTYTIRPQALIEGYQGPFEFLKGSLELIEELLAIDKIFDDKIKLGFIQGKKEKGYLLALREDIKLFKGFFGEVDYWIKNLK